MTSGWKSTHVPPGLSDDDVCSKVRDPRDCDDQVPGRAKRSNHHLDPCRQFIDCKGVPISVSIFAGKCSVLCGGVGHRDALTDTAEMVSGCGAGLPALCYGVVLGDQYPCGLALCYVVALGIVRRCWGAGAGIATV